MTKVAVALSNSNRKTNIRFDLKLSVELLNATFP